MRFFLIVAKNDSFFSPLGLLNSPGSAESGGSGTAYQHGQRTLRGGRAKASLLRVLYPPAAFSGSPTSVCCRLGASRLSEAFLAIPRTTTIDMASRKKRSASRPESFATQWLLCRRERLVSRFGLPASHRGRWHLPSGDFGTGGGSGCFVSNCHVHLNHALVCKLGEMQHCGCSELRVELLYFTIHCVDRPPAYEQGEHDERPGSSFVVCSNAFTRSATYRMWRFDSESNSNPKRHKSNPKRHKSRADDCQCNADRF
jgi:hypothetical protein